MIVKTLDMMDWKPKSSGRPNFTMSIPISGSTQRLAERVKPGRKNGLPGTIGGPAVEDEKDSLHYRQLNEVLKSYFKETLNEPIDLDLPTMKFAPPLFSSATRKVTTGFPISLSWSSSWPNRWSAVSKRRYKLFPPAPALPGGFGFSWPTW